MMPTSVVVIVFVLMERKMVALKICITITTRDTYFKYDQFKYQNL